MDNDATMLLINGEDRYVKDVYAFSVILEQLLGRDASEYFLSHVIAEPGNEFAACNGECDKTYQIQQDCENLLHEIQDELESWEVETWPRKKTAEAVNRLYQKIDREL